MDGEVFMNKKHSWSLAIIVMAVFMSLAFYYSVYAGDKPVVHTSDAAVKDIGTASITGIISDGGGKEISKYGFRWGPSSDLSQEVICDTALQADKSFAVSLSDLQPGNTYYFQAFAVNVRGISYGEVKDFTVPVNAIPVVSISSPEDNLNLTQGEILAISAAAEDDQKVESMNLYINDSLAHSVEGDALNYDWDTGSLSPGEYLLKISAQDDRQEGHKQLMVLIQEKSEVINLAINDQQPRNTESKSESIPISRSVNNYKYPNLSKVQGSFGQFYYRDTTGGRIEIDPIWVAENIVTITLPGLNKQVQVHKDAADNFITAFNYIKNGTAMINGKQVSLLSLIKSMDGTFVTRHVNWDKSRGLSNHSWGIAIDINAADHFRYVNPSWEPNDPNLILWEKAFKPAGFSWGNSYSDAMHFEVLK